MILRGEVDGDDGVGAHAVTLGVGLERRQIDDGQFGDEVGEFGNVGRISNWRMNSECQASSV